MNYFSPAFANNSPGAQSHLRPFQEKSRVSNNNSVSSISKSMKLKKGSGHGDSSNRSNQSARNQYKDMELIISSRDYMKIHNQFLAAKKRQAKVGYRMRKCLSESFCGIFCSCLKVKDQVNIPLNQMTSDQKKYRIKKLWIKARFIYSFIRMKKGSDEARMKTGLGDDDGDIDLENINSSQEQVWKWYIIRQENTLPQIWSFITNMLTIYALFATPFLLVFP